VRPVRTAFILVRLSRKRNVLDGLDGDERASEFAVCRLRIAAGGPFADGDAGAVGLHIAPTQHRQLPFHWFALWPQCHLLAYVLATAAILLVAWCISRFARYSASPGSLYTYASMILPPCSRLSLRGAAASRNIATGSSVIGGFYHYGNLLLHDATGHVTSAAFLALLVTGDYRSNCVARRQNLGRG